ncbi:MAG TPA: hypothetical protein VJZ27_05900 [Aggregatilineales bacterium]|nr:hypothetical protein [Aggregatilineales bacterium]
MRWESFVEKARQSESLPSDYEDGFLEGFETAAMELRALLARVRGLPAPPPVAEREEIVKPNNIPVTEPEWEYLYVTFEKTPEGLWRVKLVNGVSKSIWDDAMSFDEAVQQLRQKEGWRLTNFARGIHVFRRPRQ